ncbi:glycosyltransferase family 4 protein [Microbacterium sp. NPDC064584]|uniref:glycosyltransferase family 4 protein n=1 Tax=Microbacterium sp. NPDC064584 TaxID=3155817 RepID=UPI00344AE7F7
MNRPLRILHAIRSDGFAGVEQFVRRLAVAQAEAGDRVHVIGGDPRRMSEVLGGAGVGFAPAARTAEVVRAIRELHTHVQVVNTHMTAADAAAVIALTGVRARPAVVSTRHFARQRGRVGPVPIDAVVRRMIGHEIAISQAVAQMTSVPSTVVHSGVEVVRSTGTRIRRRTVLMAQRLEPEKATDVGIRAFAASGVAADGWTLEIAGRGTEQENLTRAAEALGIGAVTRFLGFRNDLPDLMSEAGILLAPCPNEGLGLTVLEAMATALPVVAADGGGHAELLEGLDERALFPIGDADRAAAALRALAADPVARAALGSRAQLRQRESFTVAAQVEGTAKVYLAAIHGLDGTAP